MSLFGLPFLGAGIFMLLIGLRVVPMQNAHSVPWWTWIVVLFMGVAFTCVGGALVFGRRWLRLDARRGRIEKQWGLLKAMKSEELDLRDFREVCLRHQAGDSDTAERFPVTLSAGPGAKDLPIYSFVNYGQGRDRGELLARFLKLPFRDASTQHAELLQTEAGSIALKTETATDEPAQTFRPQEMRCRVEEQAQATIITIPGPGFRISMLLGILIPLCLFGYFAPGLLDFFRRTHTPEPVGMAFMGFVALMFGVLPLLKFGLGVLRARRSHTRIIASPDGLTIETRGALFTRQQRIPASDIVGLDYSTASGILTAARSEAERRGLQGSTPAWVNDSSRPGSLPGWVEWLAKFAKSKGVIVKARSGLHCFAAGLPDDEVGYLYSMTKRGLKL